MDAFLCWVVLRVADTCIRLIISPRHTSPSPSAITAIESPSRSPTLEMSPPSLKDQTPKTRSKQHDDWVFRFARDLSIGLASALAAGEYEALRITIRGAHMCFGCWLSTSAMESFREYLIPGWDGGWVLGGGREITFRVPGGGGLELVIELPGLSRKAPRTLYQGT